MRALILIDTQAGTEAPETVEPYNQLHGAWVQHGAAAVQDVIAGIILGPGEWGDWFAKWGAMEPDQFTAAFHCLMHRDDITVHGMRSTFRDWAGDETGHAHQTIEAALAHTIQNKAEAAYRRRDALEKRRVLMDDWATYCAGTGAAGANVTPIRLAEAG